MKKSYINKISLKKQRQIEEELPIKILLCQIAGGTWVQTSRWGGHCEGGYCMECHQKPDFRGLHPHEDPFRSRGNKVTLASKMLCGRCHSACHGIREV